MFVSAIEEAKEFTRPIHSIMRCYKSTEIIRRLHQELKGQIPIIGSGGIDGVQNAQEKIEAGAELLQVYSGLIYHGPSLVKELVKAIK